MKKHVQTDSEWQEEMSQKIIDEIQCELYLDMPFMKLALSALSPKVNEQLYSMATDGTYIYYNPIRLIDIFKKNGMYLNRAYLHSVLHCLFFHLWTKGERDEFLWNTACDIMVEYTIDTMEKKSTKRILSYIRKTTYERLKKEHIVIAPGALYAWPIGGHFRGLNFFGHHGDEGFALVGGQQHLGFLVALHSFWIDCL